jgi:hypothetical protein
MLEEMADRIEGKASKVQRMPEDFFARLQAYCAEESQQLAAAHIHSFVTLLRGIDGLTTSLVDEIATEFDRMIS